MNILLRHLINTGSLISGTTFNYLTSNTMKADKETERESERLREGERKTQRVEPWSHMIGRSAVSGTSTVSHTIDPLMQYDPLTTSTL